MCLKSCLVTRGHNSTIYPCIDDKISDLFIKKKSPSDPPRKTGNCILGRRFSILAPFSRNMYTAHCT